MKKILFIVFALFYTCSFGTTVTVKNTGGNVNAGGTYVGGVAPGTTDTVICDGTSGQLTINTTTTVGKINFSGYTGTLTMTAALTVAGDITLGASMIISGSSALTCSATGTLTSNAKTWPNALTLSGTSMTRTLSGKWTNTGLVTFSGGTAGTLNSDTLLCNGGLTNSTSALSGTTIIYLGGGTLTASQIINNNLSFAGTSTLSNLNYGTGTLKYISGTVTTSTVTVQSSCTLDCAGIIFNSLTLNASMTLTLNSLLTVSGTLTLASNACTFAGSFGFTTATITRSSNTLAAAYTLQAGNTYTVTTAFTLNLNSCASHSSFVCSTVNGTKAILTLNSGATQSIGCYNFTDIDASGGQTINSYEGVITRCTNINSKTTANITNSY
jgi:hypothetical protein